MSFMHKAHLKRREYVWVHSIAKSGLIDHPALMYVDFLLAYSTQTFRIAK